MKFEFIEGKHGTQITITLETVEETGQLLRTAKSAKAVPADVYYSFGSGDTAAPQAPMCNIWIKKIDPKKQNNSVNNKRREK